MASGSTHSESYKMLIKLLKGERERRGVKQADLAKILGEDQSFISKVERRERRLDLEELRQYCEALGIVLGEFIAQWEEACKAGEIVATRLDRVPEADSEWHELDWKELLDVLVYTKFVSFKEIAALTLGHLNPSQVGTSIASKKTFQRHYPARKCWQAVRQWHFNQSGRCVDCGTRLELQADHVDPRENSGDDADRLDNMVLRCRRCNVVRRPSHKKGGLTFLTSESALMWILLIRKPKTYQEYEKLCRAYGLTMANVRFQESWAMAKWLEKEGLYEISSDSKF